MPDTSLPALRIKGNALLPIVQGGMGVGVSAHRLAGTVAGLGGVGTIASVDLRRHHPDLMDETGRSRDKARIDAANLEVFAKRLDGCAVNGRHWFFASGLTDVEVEITVEDTATGVQQTYANAQGTAFVPRFDTAAFLCP